MNVRTTAALAAALLGGCSLFGGEPTPDPAVDAPVTTPQGARALSEPERQALGAALDHVGGFGPFGALGGFAAREIREVAPLVVQGGKVRIAAGGAGNVYDGAGLQLEIDACGQTFANTGILAWKGLNVANQTVDEVILVMVDGLVDQGVANIDGAGGVALIFDQIANDAYFGDSGTFEIQSVALGNPQPCLGVGSGCEVLTGTLDGELDVTAQSWMGNGSINRLANFSIPAVRIAISSCPFGGTGDTGWPPNPGGGTWTPPWTTPPWSHTGDTGCPTGTWPGGPGGGWTGPGGTGYPPPGTFPPPAGGQGTSCLWAESDPSGSHTIMCFGGACACFENHVEVGQCSDVTCDPSGHCCQAFF